MIRPEYRKADQQERDAHLSSRNQILNKTYATAVWMKVIHRAVDDIVLYEVMQEYGERLKEDEIIDLESAKSFLFNDEHKIPFDDYEVIIICHICNKEKKSTMSEFSGEDLICLHCNAICSPSTSEYFTTPGVFIKDISLRELLSLWGIENLSIFRQGTKNRIEELKTKKRSMLNKKRNKKCDMKK